MEKLLSASVLVLSVLIASVSSARVIASCGSISFTQLVKENSQWKVCYGERMIPTPECTNYKTEGAALAAYKKSCGE